MLSLESNDIITVYTENRKKKKIIWYISFNSLYDSIVYYHLEYKIRIQIAYYVPYA